MEQPEDINEITLYSSPISDCSARLRIALAIKKISHQVLDVIMKKVQNTEAEYSSLNPANTIPTLVIRYGSVVLTQSLAAL
jgi:maleylacetoacetate isomerase